MKRALINIDYTYDFVAEKGALTCGEPGQEIEKEIVHLTKQYIENGDYVVFAIDKHEENDVYHPESKLFPPHNIAGTNGRELFGELQDVYETYKSAENVYYMDKTRYSAFAGTDLEMKLRERGIEEVDAYNKGFKIVVFEKAVASFNAQGHEYALGHFKSCLNAEVK